MRRIPLLVLAVLVLAPAWSDAAPAPATDPLAPIPAERWTPSAAAHLLRRAGFGGTAQEVAALHALGLPGAVASLVRYEETPNPGMPDPGIALRAFPVEDLRSLSEEERRRARNEYQRADREQFARVRGWWVERMLRTRRPLEERMTLFWHGLFTSSYRTVRNSYHMYMQNTLFRGLATGSFRELLHEVSRDPAMLRYLDGNRNRKGRPNENYAREVMELFTLGIGHYSEDDVKEAARAFTGWSFRGNRFFFARRQHDDGEKTVLGRTGRWDGDDVCRMLLDHPATAKRLARRLLVHFVRERPDDATVDALAAVIVREDYAMKPVLEALFSSHAFYDEEAVGARIKSPIELLVGLSRTLGTADRVPGLAIARSAQALGQSLMDPPNVKGWDGGRAWISTSTLLTRYNLAGALVGTGADRRALLRPAGARRGGAGREDAAMPAEGADAPGATEDGMDAPEDGALEPPEPSRGDRPGARRRGGREGRDGAGPGAGPYDPVADVRAAGLATAEEVVDHYAALLLAVPLDDALRRRLVEELRRDGGFDPKRRDAAARLHAFLRLLVSTPEFQLT
jgi:uncharacterized protein (DUF1800 family)